MLSESQVKTPRRTDHYFRTPPEPFPAPIKEPPSPPENPDVPVREPDPEDPEKV